ncbi:MAG: hypothetical protein KF693_03250 [Nitrospira sp.]|nr:hypothetical protein [Nitrospira sp.]
MKQKKAASMARQSMILVPTNAEKGQTVIKDLYRRVAMALLKPVSYSHLDLPSFSGETSF